MMTPEQREALQPCPFCGRADHLNAVVIDPGTIYAVYCDQCTAFGPRRDTPEDAEARWNIQVAALLAQPTALMAESVWQPISTAPKDRSVIVFTVVGGDVDIAHWVEEEKRWDNGWVLFDPTHWTPLPELPTK